MSKRNNFFGSKTSYTARTTAFLAATGISDTTIANALNTMDLALIANGLDTKLNALYPMVGGTATTHKFNFMNPADTDAAFRLTFTGGWTHASTGAKPNGSTGYANTHHASSALSNTDNHISYYSRTNNTELGAEMGSINGSAAGMHMAVAYAGANSYWGNNCDLSINTPVANSAGLLLITRSAATQKLYRNATQHVSKAVGANGTTAQPIVLGARNDNGTIGVWSSKECAMASIGTGLDATQESNFYTLIQAFQTALSRNV